MDPSSQQFLAHAGLAVLNEYLAEGGVNCLNGVTVTDLSGGVVRYAGADGKEGIIPVDTVIPALPRMPNRDLYRQLIGTGVELWEIGDCTGPEKIEKTIHTANYAARQVLQAADSREVTGFVVGCYDARHERIYRGCTKSKSTRICATAAVPV